MVILAMLPDMLCVKAKYMSKVMQDTVRESI